MIRVSASAYRAAATFIAEQGANIQVIIDGKLMNQQPKSKVSIVGRPGKHEISILFIDELGVPSEGYINCIELQSEYKSYYEIAGNDDCGELVRVKMEPYSSKIFKNPDYYYNRKYIARAKLKGRNKVKLIERKLT